MWSSSHHKQRWRSHDTVVPRKIEDRKDRDAGQWRRVGADEGRWLGQEYENMGRQTVQSQRQQEWDKGGEEGKPVDHNGPRFEILKLLMLSSRSSVTQLWQDLSSTGFCGTFGEVATVVVVALFNFGCDKGSSTSTTFTTAVPSNTFLTLSASTPFRGDCPEKASQKADPSLANNVWEAIEASIASWGVALGEDSGV